METKAGRGTGRRRPGSYSVRLLSLALSGPPPSAPCLLLDFPALLLSCPLLPPPALLIRSRAQAGSITKSGWAGRAGAR